MKFTNRSVPKLLVGYSKCNIYALHAMTNVFLRRNEGYIYTGCINPLWPSDAIWFSGSCSNWNNNYRYKHVFIHTYVGHQIQAQLLVFTRRLIWAHNWSSWKHGIILYITMATKCKGQLHLADTWGSCKLGVSYSMSFDHGISGVSTVQLWNWSGHFCVYRWPCHLQAQSWFKSEIGFSQVRRAVKYCYQDYVEYYIM